MYKQPQQRFCTTCGQALAPGAAFCVACGTPVNPSPAGAPGPFPAGAQSSFPPIYAQAPTQAQDDPLLAGLAAGSVASRMGRNRQLRARRPGSRLRGCGCLLLILAVLAGPFIGVALTSGRPRLIFTYVAGGMVVLIFLLLLIGMLTTRRGREALSEGCAEGCLEAILGGFLGGG
jgi:zinc ribbon protein